MTLIRFFNITLICGSIFILTGCGNSDSEQAQTAATDEKELSLELPTPVIPDGITDTNERIGYVLSHFWDELDFNDTTRSLNDAFMEQNFANFAYFMGHGTENAQKAGVEVLMDKAKVNGDAYDKVATIAELYLYELNSPMYSEALYLPFVQYISSHSFGNQGVRERASAQLKYIMKNRPGSLITDFKFETRDGHSTTLRKEIDRLSDHEGLVYLVFYDPDCEHCTETLNRLASDTNIQEQIRKGDARVIAIHSGDDYDAWKSKAESLPQAWLVGYENGAIEDDGRYEFRGSPTIYVIDGKGKVVTKDLKI